jgi:hypothetical protein
MSEDEVRAVIKAHTEERSLGFLGEARVDVLGVNLALDAQKRVAPVVSPEAPKFAPPPPASAAPAP